MAVEALESLHDIVIEVESEAPLVHVNINLAGVCQVVQLSGHQVVRVAPSSEIRDPKSVQPLTDVVGTAQPDEASGVSPATTERRQVNLAA